MFSEVLEDLENHAEKYNQDFNFNILKFDESGSNIFDIKHKIVTKLPNSKDLEPKMIYSFYYKNNLHSIYSYGVNEFIFNPNSKRYPLSGYNDIFLDETDPDLNYQFEPTYSDYNKFWEFMGMTRNFSNVMSCISGEENSSEWCLLAAYLHNKGLSMGDFLDYVNEFGEYKKQEFNMIHYLALFISYVSVNIKNSSFKRLI